MQIYEPVQPAWIQYRTVAGYYDLEKVSETRTRSGGFGSGFGGGFETVCDTTRCTNCHRITGKTPTYSLCNNAILALPRIDI